MSTGHANATLADAWDRRAVEGSNGNGHRRTSDLSSAQRSEQADRVVAQVQALTTLANEYVEIVNQHTRELVAVTRRRQRLSWFFTGR